MTSHIGATRPEYIKEKSSMERVIFTQFSHKSQNIYAIFTQYWVSFG